MKFTTKEAPMTAQTWTRRTSDGSTQTATLFADRVEFDDGTVVRQAPWNASLDLQTYLYAIDYAPRRTRTDAERRRNTSEALRRLSRGTVV